MAENESAGDADLCRRVLTSNEPEGVVDTRDNTTVGGMSDFGNVRRASGGRESNTETKDETATLELSHGLCRCLHTGTDDDDESSSEHSRAATPSILYRLASGS